MLQRALIFITLVSLAPVVAMPAYAEDTPISVSVLAGDSTFIGNTMGGAQITIRDKTNGDTLASGLTYGGSGDVAKIVTETRARNAILTDDTTAKFETSLDLYTPTVVTVTATGPMAQRQSMMTVSKDILLLPGNDYSAGNGIILELPGFAVDITSPAPNVAMTHSPDTEIMIHANVMKLDGSHLVKGGPWDPSRYKITTRIYKNSMIGGSVDMVPTKEPGEFVSKLKFQEAGIYTVYVTAFDPETKEAGSDSTTIVFSPK